MQVKVRYIDKNKKLKTCIHRGIKEVLWHDDVVVLEPISVVYRKDLVFAVIEEGDNHEDAGD